MEIVNYDSPEATPLIREDSGSEELHQTANKTNSFGSWLFSLISRIFCCFCSQTEPEQMSSNGQAERVNLPPPRIQLDRPGAASMKPPPQILKIKAFNRGESHPYSSDRVDVYINERQNMGAPLHGLSGKTPYMSTARTDKPLSVTVKVSSQGEDYRIYLPVLNKPGVLLIEEITDSLFQVTVKSYDESRTVHSTRQMALVNPRVTDEHFG